LLHIASSLGARQVFPALALELARAVAPARSVNGYGLFAVMTTRRAEIVLEGTVDGNEWLPFEFRYKPGDTGRRPEFAGLHMPRLDWQMWFAALDRERQRHWFDRLMEHVLVGTPEVRALLGRDPFGGEPLQALRAVVYAYRFSSHADWRETGEWWLRERLGVYAGPIELRFEVRDETPELLE